MASDGADDAFSAKKKQKLGDDEKKQELDETDDGEKKQELDEVVNDDFDYDELQKRFFGEPDLSWMNNRQISTHPQKVEYKEYEEEEYVNSDDDEQIQKLLFEHSKQVKESRGFDVDEFPDIRSANIVGIILPLLELSTYPKTLELLNTLSDLAITSYNQENDTNYKFLNVQKANSQVAVGVICYITFEAKNDDDDQPKIFQAKVLAGINNEHRVYSCWPKSTP
ncbi:uncharacterized protein LOC132308797 [Cornus florida]|uniref:uncharacterized protein LOC132308797 n=1 Tax=Cornus florida TaxID=4283 RepID=UPI00289835B7|nr:uncharacterized protein LOC132308797 [Cornus florida]